MAIVLDHVCKKLGKATVIDDISCTIQSGRITGFKGINGSGKTMLMRLITGLIYPSSGKVSVEGKILGKDIGFPPSIGIMLENPAFLNSYSGYENLKMIASVKDAIDGKRIEEVLRIVGLGDSGKKKYKKYSLGMKQRLGIASAIMEYPDILLLDEPTNSLDTSGVEMVKQVVRAEKERGATVVISCHDNEILEDLADEVFMIETGKITGNYIPGAAQPEAESHE